MSNLSDDAVTQLQRDYDRLLDKHNALLAAGDRLGDAAGAVLSYRASTGAFPGPVSQLWSNLQQGLKDWRSAR